jgi:hypothetical protein
MLAVSTKNRMAWRAHPLIDAWLAQSRLNGFFAIAARTKPDEVDKLKVLQQFQEAASAASSKFPALLNELN